MADNVAYKTDATATEATFRTDDDGTAHWQYVKLAWGSDNTQTIVDASNPIPVDLTASTWARASQADNLSNIFASQNVSAFGYCYDGSTWDRIRGDETDGLLVNLGTNNDVTITSGTVTAVTDITNPVAVTNAGLTELAAAINLNQMDVNLAQSSVTVTVDGTGTFAAQIDGAALTALQLIDNVVHAGSDVALASHVPISGQFDDTATTTVTEDQVAPVRINSARALHVDGSGVTQPVSGTVTANPASGTIDTVTTVSTVTNLAQMGGVAITRGNGVSGTGVQRVTLASDSTGQVKLAAGTAEIGKLAAGTAAIGKLAANSGVDIGDVDILTQPARAAATDTIGSALMTNIINNGTTALTPKFAAINATTNGDNTIVAAVVGKKVRVLSYSLVADAAVGAAFEDGAAGTELAGQMAFAANGGISVAFSPVGHFETTANTILNLELDAAANVRGHLTYVEV